jgi:60 kDa SS-A/Ro ribonucleoprotein
MTQRAQQQNLAGGYAWKVDLWKQLDRFLLLGTEGGTYYSGERSLTAANVRNLRRCVEADGPRLVRRAAEISEAGRAKDNDPAVFALALGAAAMDLATRREALAALPRVCRTGTHLLHFAAFVSGLRGWGPALRRAIARWYLDREVGPLALQLVKYRQRDGWSQRDLLRLAHPAPESDAQQALLGWAAGQLESLDALPPEAGIVAGFEKLRALAEAGSSPERTDEAARLVRSHNLPREAVPTAFLREPAVWAALLPGMPLGALVRNLGNLSKHGVLATSRRTVVSRVCRRLVDRAALRDARVHPFALLAALLTYRNGFSTRGAGEWPVVPRVVAALERAFGLAFESVEPTGRSFVVGVDVSGSMGWGEVCGVPGLTPRLAAACLAMTLVRTEPDVRTMAFAHEFRPLDLGPKSSLAEIAEVMDVMDLGGTDCALPMLWALENRVRADVFVVLTDNETWSGRVDPAEALRRYRAATGIPAKLVVVAMTADEFSIADPDDVGMIDVVGMDTHVPLLIAEAARMG